MSPSFLPKVVITLAETSQSRRCMQLICLRPLSSQPKKIPAQSTDLRTECVLRADNKGGVVREVERAFIFHGKNGDGVVL